MRITEKTTVNLGVLFVFVGAIAWVSSIFAQGLYNSREIQENKLEIQDNRTLYRAEMRRVNDKLDLLIEKVSRLEGKNGK